MSSVVGPCELPSSMNSSLDYDSPGVFPAVGPNGIKVVSMDFFLDAETPVIWRGPMKMSAIREFLTVIVWGELDYLLVDLPPGGPEERPFSSTPNILGMHGP
jgi:Mrp family chromosome partitioning ATPase